ncbi:MAG: hypothetical protein LLG13_01120 [Bacteroidales bacterium]|nr:hypothetical protein [Bacteroidales bacterium]
MREFGSEHPFIEPVKKFYRFDNFFKTEIYFRAGRDALGAAAECISSSGAVILLPAYCCESMVLPFINRKWSVKYYSLNSDFSVNEKELIGMCEKHKVKAVLLMNFFGISPVADIASSIKEYSKEIIIIEDFTHTLFSDHNLSDKNINFKISSIRKWIGIPDGAVLLTNSDCSPSVGRNDENFLSLRIKGMALKFKYNLEKDPDLKKKYLQTLRDAETCLNDYSACYAISNVSINVLSSLDIEEIRQCRFANFNHLLSLIIDVPGVDLVLKTAPSSVPFSLPILVRDRDLVQRKFAERGLYAPVLWPLNNQCRNTCNFSSGISDTMLSLPVDQRYDYEDIEEIGRIVRSVLVES